MKSRPWEEHWTRLDKIGGGGQGQIHKVQNKVDRSFAVLKELADWRKDNEQSKSRLNTEANILQRLTEAGAKVPRILDSSSRHLDSEPFILMEHIPGTTFDAWLAQYAPVSLDKSLAITNAIANTLQLCHSLCIGHRDLKPANIILKGDSIEEPYVLDFGISYDSHAETILTASGEIFWNEFIRLPECIDLAGGNRDPRSDVAALAGLLFTCITGQPPVVLLDKDRRAPHIRHAELIQNSISSPIVHERLLWLFSRAFQYRPNDRHASIGSFLEEMNAVTSTFGSPFDFKSIVNDLDSFLEQNDRSIQLTHLRKKNIALLNKINAAILKWSADNSPSSFKFTGGQFAFKKFKHFGLPPHPEILFADTDHVTLIEGSRSGLMSSACVLTCAVASENQIVYYIASFIRDKQHDPKPSRSSRKVEQEDVELSWTKLVTITEEQNDLTPKQLLAIKELSGQLFATEFAAIARQTKSRLQAD